MRNRNLVKKNYIPKAILLLAILISAVVYIRYVWIKTKSEQIESVLQIARSVEATLPKEDVKLLEAKPEDIDKPQYKAIKEALKSVINVNPSASFAYIYTEKNGKIFFAVDSEPEDSEDYSPPGQEYNEAKPEDHQPFRDGKERLTPPMTDRWGTWTSALIPVKDDATGKIVAVFGMDFDAKSWNRTIIFKVAQSSLFIVLLLALLFVFYIQSKNKLLKHDLTARKIAENKLLETNAILESATARANEMAAKAEMANKSKSLFLANMSHEIRTPLNAIIGFSQLLNRDKQLTSSQKEYSISIVRAGEHLLSLINDILELSKIEAGRVVLNPTNVDLYTLLEDIHKLFKDRAQSKHLQFISEISDDLPRFVFVDDSKLRQIFVNLIGNAIKFTEEGGIAVRTRTDKIDEDTNRLIVEIQDSGPGIPQNEISKLFRHFEQTSSGINSGSGTGLGLALSRELAILMGGDISVSSEPGKGSVFTFNVEIKIGKEEAIETTVTQRVIGISNPKKVFRVLVVDDKDENLKVAVNLLRLVGFETQEAINGKDAIEKFEEWNPHLILMDMRMPVMDGYEASRLIKATEKGKQTPIVALTASAFEDERKKIKSLGMQGYIRKPFRENELFSTIGKILDIEYIYEEEAPILEDKYLDNKELIAEDIAKLPKSLVIQMTDALAVADLDLLIDLIESIDGENDGIAQKLLNLTRNYEYDNLQQLLN